MKYDVVAFGENLIDFVPAKEQTEDKLTFSGFPGGAPANVLACVARLGGKTSFITKVGNDVFGRFLLKTFHQYQIDTSHVILSDEYPTTLAFVALDEAGDREFSFYRNQTADVMVNRSEVDVDVLRQTRVFHFGSLSLTSPVARDTTFYLLELAKKENVCISYDPNLRASLWKSLEEAKEQMLQGMRWADIVKVSEEEIQFLTGIEDIKEGAKALYRDYGLKLLVVTLGKNGCLWYANGEFGKAEGFPVNAVDTVGAGDAFFGSVLSGLLRYDFSQLESMKASELYDVMRFANAVAAVSTTRHGGISSLPSRSEVSKFLGTEDR